MNISKRLAALEAQHSTEELKVLICSVVDKNHYTGVLAGYRVGHRGDETLHLLPDETEEELQKRAVERYRQLYPDIMKRNGNSLVILDEVYDKQKGYCIPVKRN